jgi:hypothetical protein
MEEAYLGFPPADETRPAVQAHRPVSGTYIGQRGSNRLELRVDLAEQGPEMPYQSLNLVSGDMFWDVGGGEWDYRCSFIVEHPLVRWGIDEVVIRGVMTYYRDLELAPTAHHASVQHLLRVTIPLCPVGESSMPATVHVIRWGTHRTVFVCNKTSVFFRTIQLEIDRITGTELPQPFQTHTVVEHPTDLPPLDLDITRAYQRAGVDLHIISDGEVFAPAEAGADLKWDEDELHNAMEHHFSQWRDEPQWKLYLLIATHFRFYPSRVITGIMYDSHYCDPNDPFPRQGVAAFYSSMNTVWGKLPQAAFDRNYLRTCVHELGHALNLLHSFDKDRPESPSWMNYPWRYPYGYNLPPGWNGTDDYWQNCRFEFDAEELRHLRHHALKEVIPGGAAFGALGHDVPAPLAISPRQQTAAPVALYVRTRPERYLFHFAEPVTVELKLKNQTQAPMVAPDMLNPEFGLLELFIRDPKGQLCRYNPLFKLCGEARTVELPPGEKLYETVFLAYGAEGFYFEEPGEYQIWAAYGAGGLRLRSNVLRIRVAFPQTSEDEEMALWTFGRDQGHVLYMRGANHLQTGNDQLREVTERFPKTNLSRYIHFCFGNGQAREFKDVVKGQVRQPQPEHAIQQLEKARAFSPQWEKRSSLDNITHGRAVNLLSDLYRQVNQPEQARSVLTQTARYFKRMEVKQEVIAEIRKRAESIAGQ